MHKRLSEVDVANVRQRAHIVERIVGAILTLGIDGENAKIFAQMGTIQILIRFLSIDGHVIPENFILMRNSIIAIGILSYHDDNKKILREADGLAPLIALLSIQNEVYQEKASGALMNLVLDSSFILFYFILFYFISFLRIVLIYLEFFIKAKTGLRSENSTELFL